MNTKIYWRLRYWWLKLTFCIKKFRYSILNKRYNAKKTNGIGVYILKMIVLRTLTSGALCIGALYLDKILMQMAKQCALDNKMFLDIVIGGIGVAGVILGLYCSNMSSTFSSKYTNAPESINRLFQRDIITNRCVKQIIGYITLCICILAVCIAEIDFYFATVTLLLFLTIRTIVTFSISGNRAYDLSNTYRIADVLYPDIKHILEKLPSKKYVDVDPSFQAHYRKVCSKHINVLRDIAIYNKTNSDNQTAPVISFLQNNIYMLFEYLKKKPYIPYDSEWFSEKTEYQQWHTASVTEVSSKIRFGLMLDTMPVKDYIWFETAIESVNDICLDVLIKAEDYTSIYNFLVLLSDVPTEMSDEKTIVYWNKYIISLKDKILPIIDVSEDMKYVDEIKSGIVDAYAVLCFNTMMAICKYISELNLKDIFKSAISIERYFEVDLYSAKYINNEYTKKFYDTIEIEKRVEKQRITPDWYIEQIVAKTIYEHINLLVNILEDLFTFAATVGTDLLSKKNYYSVAIWFSRLSEIDAKMSNLKVYDKFAELEQMLLSKKKDPTVLWEDSNIHSSIEKIKKISCETPRSLKKCSGIFALTHQDNRKDYPDLLGYCYNRICDNLVSAIVDDDFPTFKTMYNGFLGSVLLYQEYIRTDVIKRKEKYMQSAVYDAFSAPILEFAMISGMAILWGEFMENQDWRSIVEEELKPYLDKKNYDDVDVLSWMVQIISNRKSALMALGSRSILQTSWEQRVSAAIINHPSCKLEYGPYGQERIVSNSKLFSAFASHSLASFGTLDNTEEFYCVLCINPYLKQEEKYHTRSKWEEEIDDA